MGGTLRGYDASLATGRQKGGRQRIMFMCNTHEHVALPTPITELLDYEEFCRLDTAALVTSGV